jgi:hypothetical protein
MYESSRENIVEQSLILKPITPSRPTDLVGLRSSAGFEISNPEIGGNGKRPPPRKEEL